MFCLWQNNLPKWAAPPLEPPPKSAAPMARPKLPLTVLRRHQVTLSLRDAELVELRRRASAARLPVPDYLRQRALSERLRVASPRRLAAAEFREVSRLAVNVNQIARCLHQGRLLPKGTRVAVERLRPLLLQLLPQAKD